MNQPNESTSFWNLLSYFRTAAIYLSESWVMSQSLFQLLKPCWKSCGTALIVTAHVILQNREKPKTTTKDIEDRRKLFWVFTCVHATVVDKSNLSSEFKPRGGADYLTTHVHLLWEIGCYESVSRMTTSSTQRRCPPQLRRSLRRRRHSLLIRLVFEPSLTTTKYSNNLKM